MKKIIIVVGIIALLMMTTSASAWDAQVKHPVQNFAIGGAIILEGDYEIQITHGRPVCVWLYTLMANIMLKNQGRDDKHVEVFVPNLHIEVISGHIKVLTFYSEMGKFLVPYHNIYTKYPSQYNFPDNWCNSKEDYFYLGPGDSMSTVLCVTAYDLSVFTLKDIWGPNYGFLKEPLTIKNKDHIWLFLEATMSDRYNIGSTFGYDNYEHPGWWISAIPLYGLT